MQFLIANTIPLFQNKLLIFIMIIFGFTTWHVGILVPWPGIEPMPPAVKAQHPHHWTAREFPKSFHFKMILDLQKVGKIMRNSCVPLVQCLLMLSFYISVIIIVVHSYWLNHRFYSDFTNSKMTIFYKIILFIFWRCWVFVAAQAVSSCGERGICFGAWPSHCSGFSCCRARALWHVAQWLQLPGSRAQALECGTQA